MIPDTRTAATLGYAFAIWREWELEPRDSRWLVWQCGRFVPEAQSDVHDLLVSLKEDLRGPQFD